MKRHTVRFTEEAEADLLRLYGYLLERNPSGGAHGAERALEAIAHGIELLHLFPYTCRKAVHDNPYLRELVIPFGASGYVVLFEIESGDLVTVRAERHLRESDCH